MKALVLRSPSLAGGGPAHVVRLYERADHARGGMARPAREVMMHLTGPELAQLTARWGAPATNPRMRIPEYGFPAGSLARMASGGALRTRTTDPVDYAHYGEGPEHEFFAYPPATAEATEGGGDGMVTLPSNPTGPSTQSARAPSGGGTNLAGLGSALGSGAALAKALGYDNALTQGASAAGNLAGGNYTGALKSGLKLYDTMTAPSMADYASGQALDDALAERGITGTGTPAEGGAASGSSNLSRGLSGVGGALNIYGGLKQGGVQGYAQAGTGAAQLAGAAGVGGSAVANAVPVLGAVTGGYGTLKSIQAGDKKNAALSGAATGASIGSIVPGIGTALGAVIGGLVGGVGAAIHGKDYAEEKVRDKYYDLLDPAKGNFDTSQQVDPKSFYQAVAGEFRGSHSAYAPRSSGKYGKKDEDAFISDMSNKINDAYRSGVIDKGATAQDVMSKVIDPWFQSDFGGWRTDIPEAWQADQRAMTTDLVNRYISGSPVDWGVISGSGPNTAHPVAAYLGLARGGGLSALSSGSADVGFPEPDSGSAGSAEFSSNARTSTRHVRGPGTGRSDSIPAQLSDGEYVFTAEDVSLLGDGSNEAGAKRLDQFRQQLRKHKGRALARGKISPNAKPPMGYLRSSA